MTHEHTHYDHSQILKGLESSDSLMVIETLEELRVSGKVADIPILIELLHLTQNPEIKSRITNLFANLKESDAIPLIIEAIRDQKYAPELKELIACCWENGLDYSNYLSLFVDLLIESEFFVAFEAYTVIMNNDHSIEQSIIDHQVERLETALPTTPDMKRQLLIDVIDFLPGLRF
jgi:HEAT repeat protein